MRKFTSAILALFLFIPVLSAKVPEFPPLSGQVVDQADILTPQQKDYLIKQLAADQNNQIVVAIVNNLQGMEGREYGIELARRWQLGQKDKDNGILFLIAVKDRYVGIEVGYGLEGILPDSLTGRIISEQMLPELRNNNYYQAIINGTTAVMSVISQKELTGQDSTAEDILSLIFTLLVIYLMLSGKIRGGGFGGGFGSRSGGFAGRGRFTGGGGNFGGGGAGRHF